MFKKISIRELLLLTLLVALFLAWRSAIPAANELRRLRLESGHIRQDSEDIVYIRQRDSEHDSQWRFEIKLPQGANYRYLWTYSLGDSAPLYEPRKIKCSSGRQCSLSITARRGCHVESGKEWAAFGYHGNLNDEIVFVEDKVAEHLQRDKFPRFQNLSGFTTNFGATYDYDSGLHQFSVGETIQLLRLEGTHPDSGEQIWIELNIVPMSDEEVRSHSQTMMIPGDLMSMESAFTKEEDQVGSD